MAAWKTVLCLLTHMFLTTISVLGDNDVVSEQMTIDDKSEESPRVVEETSWPGLTHLGQVSAVAVDGDGNLHVFHRGNRVWDENTFDKNYQLNNRQGGPIQNDTVLVLDPNTGKTLYSWGANRFYVPHGMTVDRKGNTWVTDVGLHQVLKFPPRENKPSLAIGEAFIPGAGRSHLCQPSDVVVAKPGYVFVSDGYCNSRILMFSRTGHFIKEIGAKDGMTVPHSLTLVPEHGAICVADRENWRILCYSSGMDGTLPGLPLAQLEGQGLGRVFGIDRRGDQLFAVNGPDPWQSSQSVSSSHGLVIDIETGTPKTMWGPDQGFLGPHDLAISPDGNSVYVAELDVTAPKRVYKFNIMD